MVEITCERIKYLIKDETKASREYASWANKLKKFPAVREKFKHMSRDEKRHHDDLVKMKSYVCKR